MKHACLYGGLHRKRNVTIGSLILLLVIMITGLDTASALGAICHEQMLTHNLCESYAWSDDCIYVAYGYFEKDQPTWYPPIHFSLSMVERDTGEATLMIPDVRGRGIIIWLSNNHLFMLGKQVSGYSDTSVDSKNVITKIALDGQIETTWDKGIPNSISDLALLGNQLLMLTPKYIYLWNETMEEPKVIYRVEENRSSIIRDHEYCISNSIHSNHCVVSSNSIYFQEGDMILSLDVTTKEVNVICPIDYYDGNPYYAENYRRSNFYPRYRYMVLYDHLIYHDCTENVMLCRSVVTGKEQVLAEGEYYFNQIGIDGMLLNKLYREEGQRFEDHVLFYPFELQPSGSISLDESLAVPFDYDFILLDNRQCVQHRGQDLYMGGKIKEHYSLNIGLLPSG